MHCASTCRKPQHFLKRSRRLSERASLRQPFAVCIPNAKISVLTTPCSNRAAKKQPAGANLISSEGFFALNAAGNFVHSPHKFVAAVGVNDLVIVETDDALLITTREHAQDVGKIVKYLDEKQLLKLV